MWESVPDGMGGGWGFARRVWSERLFSLRVMGIGSVNLVDEGGTIVLITRLQRELDGVFIFIATHIKSDHIHTLSLPMHDEVVGAPQVPNADVD